MPIDPSVKGGSQFAAVNFHFGKCQHSLQRFDLMPADVMQLQELQRRFGPCPHPQAEAHCWYIPGPCYQKKGESCMKAAAGDPRHGCVFSLGSRSVSQDPGVAFSSLLLALAWVGPGLGELGLWVMIKLLYSGLASNNMWHYGEKLFNLSKKKV